MAMSAHGSANDRNGPPAPVIRFTIANKSNIECSSRSMHVTTTQQPGRTALRISSAVLRVGSIYSAAILVAPLLMDRNSASLNSISRRFLM